MLCWISMNSNKLPISTCLTRFLHKDGRLLANNSTTMISLRSNVVRLRCFCQVRLSMAPLRRCYVFKATVEWLNCWTCTRRRVPIGKHVHVSIQAFTSLSARASIDLMLVLYFLFASQGSLLFQGADANPGRPLPFLRVGLNHIQVGLITTSRDSIWF